MSNLPTFLIKGTLGDGTLYQIKNQLNQKKLEASLIIQAEQLSDLTIGGFAHITGAISEYQDLLANKDAPLIIDITSASQDDINTVSSILSERRFIDTVIPNEKVIIIIDKNTFSDNVTLTPLVKVAASVESLMEKAKEYAGGR
jgi:hypothetical protein